MTNLKEKNQNFISPKEPQKWKPISNKGSALKVNETKEEPLQRVRGSIGDNRVQSFGPVQQQKQQEYHRQYIYSSLDKQQSQVIGAKPKGQLPDLNDPYVNIHKLNKPQEPHFLNHQMSGIIVGGRGNSSNIVGNRGQAVNSNKYSLNQSSQNLAMRNQQQFRIYQGFQNEAYQLQVSNSNPKGGSMGPQ